MKFLLSTLSFSFQRINLPACRRVLWILLVRSCTVCFVFVFVYTFPLAQIFASSNLNPPPFFVSSSSFLTFWWAQLCPRLAQHRLGFACFRFLAAYAIGLLRRFLYPILDPLAFVPNTFYTRNLSKYGLFQNPGLHTCFGLNLNRGFNKTNVFASTLFYTKSCFTQNCVIHKHHVLHKNHILAGPVQGLFAAFRIDLSMVAGRTRRRWLNIFHFSSQPCPFRLGSFLYMSDLSVSALSFLSQPCPFRFNPVPWFSTLSFFVSAGFYINT